MVIPMTYKIDDFAAWARAKQDEARIYAEGDSWFAYPGTNVITEIRDDAAGDPVICHKASSGDEAADMLSGKQRHALMKDFEELKKRNDHLRSKDSAISVEPHFLLFSGGGNDIVGGHDFPMLIQNKPAGSPPHMFVREGRFKNRLDQIRTSYMEIGFIRDDFFPNCPIITHKYDFPIPSNTGVQVFGINIIRSWMKPYMDEIGINSADDQKGIARYLISQFGAMLDQLKGIINNFHVINTHGLLGPGDWQNEIHPTNEGFGWVAEKFRNTMKALNPSLAFKL